MANIAVTIDLNDIFPDADDNASVLDILQDSIKSTVQYHIRELIKDSVQREIREQVGAEVKKLTNSFCEDKIQQEINEVFKTWYLPSRYDTSLKVNVEGYIKNFIDDNTRDRFARNLSEKVDTVTSACIKKLQDQYNMQFAASLVSKMRDAELLSEKGLQALLSNGEQS